MWVIGEQQRGGVGPSGAGGSRCCKGDASNREQTTTTTTTAAAAPAVAVAAVVLLLRCYCDAYFVLWDGKRTKRGASWSCRCVRVCVSIACDVLWKHSSLSKYKCGERGMGRVDCFVILSCVLTYVLVSAIHTYNTSFCCCCCLACIINRLQPGSPKCSARLYATHKWVPVTAESERVCVCVCMCVYLRHFCLPTLTAVSAFAAAAPL